MATFLSLCADLARESGAIGTPPATVVGTLPQRQAQCVGWIRTAWTLIQNLHPDWLFLRGSFDAPLTVGVNTYAASALGIATRFGEWLGESPASPAVSIYDSTIGRKDENWLRQISYAYWRRAYDFGAQTNQRPTQWTIAPSGALLVGPAPDKAYRVRGEYRKSPQVLAADNDVPDMPERFHDAIWQRALILMGESDEAGVPMQAGQMEFAQSLMAMTRDLLPKVGVRGEGAMDRR